MFEFSSPLENKVVAVDLLEASTALNVAFRRTVPLQDDDRHLVGSGELAEEAKRHCTIHFARYPTQIQGSCDTARWCSLF